MTREQFHLDPLLLRLVEKEVEYWLYPPVRLWPTEAVRAMKDPA